MLKDSGVQGKGARSEGQAASKATGKAQGSGKAEGSGKTNDPNAAQQTNGQGREGGAGGQGQVQIRRTQGQAVGVVGRPGRQEGQGSGPSPATRPRAKSSPATRPKAIKRPRARTGSPKTRPMGRTRPKREIRKTPSQTAKSPQQENQDDGDSSSQGPKFPPFSLPALDWLQTPIMVVGIAIVIYGLIRYHRDLLQVLLAILKAILAVFGFGWGNKPAEAKEEAAEPRRSRRRARSPRIANPFDAGMDQQLTPDDLIIYSFEALEAWAYEQGDRSLPRTRRRPSSWPASAKPSPSSARTRRGW